MPAYEVRRRRFGGRKLVSRPHGTRELVWAPTQVKHCNWRPLTRDRSKSKSAGLSPSDSWNTSRALGVPKPVR